MIDEKTTVLKITDLHKSFGNLDVIKGVSMEVKKGEVIVILGPSGSGKTTFLRCLNFLESAQKGKIKIDDIEIDCAEKGVGRKKKVTELRKKTAMVFQNYNLFKNMTLLKNVMEGPITVQKRCREEVEIDSKKLLAKVGLGDKEDYYPSQLSGGQQQRGGIVRALMLNPSVILFDEPTSALDPELVGEVLNTMKNIADTGITMMVVTHEISFARNVATKVIFMADGNIVEQGPPSQVIDNPQNEKTKKFLNLISEK
ncbi:MAG: amino acid ABC transporter ATP-binding protein [Clostridia bacterium]|jgi:L-cystine transport system ATP-binding protein|nr:amino acid ABC transporter ATP-binding protein [Clostridia bacterium]MCI2014491.1 amino acid ABC transporter ATP-binding protein [Clostridia bacterium]